jgi:Fe-S-cluster containining protein
MYSALYLVIQKRGSPLPFECIQCGECCSHLGLVHSIREERGGNRFLLYNQYTGDEQEVVLDSDKIDLFSDKSTFEREPEACPFFRLNTVDRKGYCTIHLTRPDICRDFSCWRLLILDHAGMRAGRVMFIRTLVTEDTILRRLWDECIDTIPDPDDSVWESTMIHTLTRAGYSVRR